jgi:hypothetical protein
MMRRGDPCVNAVRSSCSQQPNQQRAVCVRVRVCRAVKCACAAADSRRATGAVDARGSEQCAGQKTVPGTSRVRVCMCAVAACVVRAAVPRSCVNPDAAVQPDQPDPFIPPG